MKVYPFLPYVLIVVVAIMLQPYARSDKWSCGKEYEMDLLFRFINCFLTEYVFELVDA